MTMTKPGQISQETARKLVIAIRNTMPLIYPYHEGATVVDDLMEALYRAEEELKS